MSINIWIKLEAVVHFLVNKIVTHQFLMAGSSRISCSAQVDMVVESVVDIVCMLNKSFWRKTCSRLTEPASGTRYSRGIPLLPGTLPHQMN
jgi:hypothetical protein